MCCNDMYPRFVVIMYFAFVLGSRLPSLPHFTCYFQYPCAIVNALILTIPYGIVGDLNFDYFDDVQALSETW